MTAKPESVVLKPCPFCGGAGEERDPVAGGPHVACSNENCCAWAMLATPNEWNTRLERGVEATIRDAVKNIEEPK